MPRTNRVTPGGMVFPVLNRGVGRMRLFDSDADYLAFENILEETFVVQPMRLLSYCLMPNHWHFVLWPKEDGDLAAFMQRLTVTHVTRWQRHKKRVGYGHVYQGRFKSFPVSSDEYFFQVVRYVERNALRAGLIRQAERWRWSSLWRRESGTASSNRSWPSGRCRRPHAGLNSSMKFKPRASSRRCGAASTAGNRSVPNRGSSAASESWGWNRRFARADAPEREIRQSTRPLMDL